MIQVQALIILYILDNSIVYHINNFSEGKQGIFFPQIEGLIDALIEKDRIMMQYKQIKLDFDQIEDNSD